MNHVAESCPAREVTGGALPAGQEELENTDTASLLARLFSTTSSEAGVQAYFRRRLGEEGSLVALFSAARRGGPSGEDEAYNSWLLGIRELMRRRFRQELVRGPALASPADTTRFLQLELGDRRREVFVCLFLDTRHRVIAANELFQGSIDGACVYPRVVAERALRLGAAAVIVAHNHPSGVSEPSLADQAITRRLKDALALLEIRLLDHFVIGDGDPVSMASRGML